MRLITKTISTAHRPMMEYAVQLKNKPPMLLKEDSGHVAVPEGSPLLSATSPMPKPAVNLNGGTTENGYPFARVPTNVPLKVEVNGLKQVRTVRSSNMHSTSTSLSNPSTPIFSGTGGVPSGSDSNVLNNSANSEYPTLLQGASTSTATPRTSNYRYSYSNRAAQQNYVSDGAKPSTSNENNDAEMASFGSVSGYVMTPSTQNVRRRDVETERRRAISEKIIRCRERNGFNFLIPQCHTMTPNQLAIIAKKLRKPDSAFPNRLKRVVFDDVEESPPTKKTTKRMRDDADEYTDVSDLELSQEEISRISQKDIKFHRDKVEIGFDDSILANRIEEASLRLTWIKSHIRTVRSQSAQCLFEESDKHESCARTRALLTRSAHRIIHSRLPEELRSGDEIPSSSSQDGFTLPSTKSVSDAICEYFDLISSVPPLAVRKRCDKSIHSNFSEMDEEQQRNGWQRFAEKEKRRLKELEREEREARGKAYLSDSSDYEDTDESDEEYAPKGKMKLQSQGIGKKKRGRPPKDPEAKNIPMSVTKIRKHGSTHRGSHSQHYEAEDLFVEDVLTPIPEQREYKEIVVPSVFELPKEHVEKFNEFVILHPSGLETAVDLITTIAGHHAESEARERCRNRHTCLKRSCTCKGFVKEKSSSISSPSEPLTPIPSAKPHSEPPVNMDNGPSLRSQPDHNGKPKPSVNVT